MTTTWSTDGPSTSDTGDEMTAPDLAPVPADRPIELAVVGAGARGDTYAAWAARHPDEVRVVAVAEPDDARRDRFAAQHALPGEAVARSWEELAERDRVADLVAVATQDDLHVEPAEVFAAQGHHLLLEKPIAPDPDGVERVARAVAASGVRVHVAHVLRHTRLTTAVRAAIAEGRIGEVVAIQRLEPVGYWHFAHSYVRGNWRNESLSSPVLLAKSCHDIDWINHIVGGGCRSVASFGALHHFRPETKPAAAGDATRCLGCAHEPDCAWSAASFYLPLIDNGWTGFPLTALTTHPSPESVREALADGPYGRCVHECDNDVPDTQSVLLEFDGGVQASFTLSAFTEARLRETRILGTEGELRADGASFEIFRFLDDRTSRISPNGADATSRDLLGHGGGDDGLMRAVVDDLRDPDPTPSRVAFDEAIDAHRIVFAAERARRQRRVVDLAPTTLAPPSPEEVAR